MKDIYIMHQYWEPSHFNALYQSGEKIGIKIRWYMILEPKEVIMRSARILKYERKPIKALASLICQLLYRIECRRLRDKTIIVGLAPYDPIMVKYRKVFSRNNTCYFTSWDFWDGSSFPRGTLNDKEKFESVLKKDFTCAACVNKAAYEGIRPWFQRIEIVRHSIQTAEYAKRPLDRPFQGNYLFLGTLSKRKNVHLILWYMRKYPKACIEITFAGEGDLRKQIQEAARYDKRIHWRGYWSKDYIKRHLCDYDFLLLPSVKEPFGIVLIEALAAGVPCITSDLDGPASIIRDSYNGYLLCRDGFPDSFVPVMNKSQALTGQEYASLCRNALKSGKEYDSQNIVEKWKKALGV